MERAAESHKERATTINQGATGPAPPDSKDSHGGGAAPAREVAHAAVRGAIASAAMSGIRRVTVGLGIVEEPPPQAIFRQKTKGLIRLVPKRRRRAAIELAHWGYGSAAGAAFALLPDSFRRRAWAGPAYGLAVWAGFEAGVAPALGLSQAKRVRPLDRLGLAADHLLYGFVLSEMRRRPQERAGFAAS